MAQPRNPRIKARLANKTAPKISLSVRKAEFNDGKGSPMERRVRTRFFCLALQARKNCPASLAAGTWHGLTALLDATPLSPLSGCDRASHLVVLALTSWLLKHEQFASSAAARNEKSVCKVQYLDKGAGQPRLGRGLWSRRIEWSRRAYALTPVEMLASRSSMVHHGGIRTPSQIYGRYWIVTVVLL